jgi:hypothetical protein
VIAEILKRYFPNTFRDDKIREINPKGGALYDT